MCRACNPVSPNYGEVIKFLNRLDAQAAAAEAAAMEQELRKMVPRRCVSGHSRKLPSRRRA